MKKAFIYCFDKWWRPVLFFAFITVFTLVCSELDIIFFYKPLNFLAGASLIALLISFCYQLYMKRFVEGFISIVFVFAIGLVQDVMILVDGDHWADGLKIPAGIQIEPAIGDYGVEKVDTILNLDKNQANLVLYNSFQPGIYHYEFWTGKIESGFIYLKAFEITNGDALSADNLEKNTQLSIANVSDTVARFSSKKDFKIYEGDWGKFYAARFEVWFKPTLGGEERKIFQKNFKIEGWMH